MPTVAFNTHAYVKRLKAAGVLEEQAAETLVQLIEGELATKRDIEELRSDMKAMELGLRRDIVEAKVDLLKWLVVVLLFIQTGLVVALIKLL